MKINTNISSLTAQEASTNTNKSINNSLEKLSTGLKINKASDDASGLAIADKLRTQVTSINQGIANGNSAVALLQIADKSMAEQSTILDTVKAKLIQANTDTTSDAGREAIRKDVSKLLQQLDNIATQSNYNGTPLLADVKDGKLTGKDTSALSFQVGENSTDLISTAAINSTTEKLGGGSGSAISEIKAGESAMLKNVEGGSLSVSAKTGQNLDTNVKGNLGKLTAEAGTITLSLDTTDTETIAKLKALTNANFTQNTTFDNIFTLTGGEQIDLSGVDFKNVKITGAAAADSFGATGKNFTVINNDTANGLEVSSTQKVIKGQTATVTSSDTTKPLEVTSTAPGELNMKVSGNLGQLSVTPGPLNIETTNTAEAAALQKMIDDGNTNITRTGDKFVLVAAGNPFDFSNIKLSDAKVTGNAPGDTFSTTSSEPISITNFDEESLILSGIDALKGNTLNGLKDLGENGLTRSVAETFQTVVDDGITQLNAYRGDIGSTQNQVESAVRNLMTQATNIKNAESVIRDVDYAEESANFNKLNIISQAGSYAISQSNAVSQNVLRLLQ